MTTPIEPVSYLRPEGVLWRDTGHHVVVLTTGSSTAVKVLAGGGAAVWRLLDHPSTVKEMIATFSAEDEEAPSASELESCLQELSRQGLIGTTVQS